VDRIQLERLTMLKTQIVDEREAKTLALSGRLDTTSPRN